MILDQGRDLGKLMMRHLPERKKEVIRGILEERRNGIRFMLRYLLY